jgi:hypothetical protein
MVPDWAAVHSIMEIRVQRGTRILPKIRNTIRNKSLCTFSAHRSSRRCLINAWLTSDGFGVSYFYHSGEIQARWTYEPYVRLIAGLAFGSEELLGYDYSLKQCEKGRITEIRVKSKWYSIVFFRLTLGQKPLLLPLAFLVYPGVL